MALIKCTECGNDVSPKAVTCPNCGAPMVESESQPASLDEGGVMDQKVQPRPNRAASRIAMVAVGLVVCAVVFFWLMRAGFDNLADDLGKAGGEFAASLESVTESDRFRSETSPRIRPRRKLSPNRVLRCATAAGSHRVKFLRPLILTGSSRPTRASVFSYHQLVSYSSRPRPLRTAGRSPE